MAKYSKDLKEQAVKYVLSGKSYAAASEIFGATVMLIRNWHRRYLELGHVGNMPYLGKRPRVSNEEFAKYIELHPDETLKEISAYFGITAVGALYYMRKCGIKYKKRAALSRSMRGKKGRIFKRNINNKARIHCIY